MTRYVKGVATSEFRERGHHEKYAHSQGILAKRGNRCEPSYRRPSQKVGCTLDALAG